MCGRRCTGLLALASAFLVGLVLKAGDPPSKPRRSRGRRPARLYLETAGAYASTRCVFQTRTPDGFPAEDDFGVATLPLRALGEGEVLVRSRWISVDPYMRNGLGGGGQRLEPVNVSDAKGAIQQVLQRLVGGENVGVVVESRAEGLPAGSLVRGHWHWCEAAVLPHASVFPLEPYHQPPSSALGTLGMTGRTAYYGVFDVLRPKAGEVLFISGAHGATGAVAGQLGKLAGLRVLGSAGTDDKVKELYDLGFDAAFNYRIEQPGDALRRLAPDGLDLYFDNTGGPVSEAAAFHMNGGGRVAICGQIHWYERSGTAKLMLQLLRAVLPHSSHSAWHLLIQPWSSLQALVLKAVVHVAFPWSLATSGQCLHEKTFASALTGRAFTFEGFLVSCFDKTGRLQDTEQKLASYVKGGKVKVRQDVLLGTIEDAPKVFVRMLSGANRGKQILEIPAEDTSADA